MSDTEPIKFTPRQALTSSGGGNAVGQTAMPMIRFDRQELNTILRLYGRMVATGEWRDYAMDFLRDRAVFSVFRRSSEVPLYRIEKNPAHAQKQGAYSVVAPGGLIMKRGQDLERVLRVLDKTFFVVSD